MFTRRLRVTSPPWGCVVSREVRVAVGGLLDFSSARWDRSLLAAPAGGAPRLGVWQHSHQPADLDRIPKVLHPVLSLRDNCLIERGRRLSLLPDLQFQVDLLRFLFTSATAADSASLMGGRSALISPSLGANIQVLVSTDVPERK